MKMTKKKMILKKETERMKKSTEMMMHPNVQRASQEKRRTMKMIRLTSLVLPKKLMTSMMQMGS
jgi:hypothetical protein